MAGKTKNIQESSGDKPRIL